jgi:predicted RNA-binding protein with PIN domain
MLLAIDGYNYIKQTPNLRKLEEIELQKAREGLVGQLAQYKKIKGHSIIVVFDGWQGGTSAGHRERSQGIEIIFSKAGEKADDVLKRLAAEKRDGITIVTSDNDVAFFAEKKGAAVISTAEFEDKMEMAKYFDAKGGAEETDSFKPFSDTTKKGPSRRLSKSQRKTIAKAKKL